VFLTIPMKNLVKFGHQEGHQFEYQSVGAHLSVSGATETVPGRWRHARAIAARPLPPPRVGAIDRLPRPLHVQRMQSPPRVSSPRAVGPKEKLVLSSSHNGRRALATPLCLSPRLYSFIAAPLSPLRRRTSRPTSYRPVSPTSPPSRCSQPRGKSTTDAPAWALCHPPSSAMANSSSTGRLRLSSPLCHLPEHHRGLGYLPASSTSAPPTPHWSSTFRWAHHHREPTPVSLPPSKTPNWVPHLAI
jgi:hypothetical protein